MNKKCLLLLYALLVSTTLPAWAADELPVEDEVFLDNDTALEEDDEIAALLGDDEELTDDAIADDQIINDDETVEKVTLDDETLDDETAGAHGSTDASDADDISIDDLLEEEDTDDLLTEDEMSTPASDDTTNTDTSADATDDAGGTEDIDDLLAEDVDDLLADDDDTLLSDEDTSEDTDEDVVTDEDDAEEAITDDATDDDIISEDEDALLSDEDDDIFGDEEEDDMDPDSEDFNEEGFEDEGEFDHTVGTQIPLGILGPIPFAPSPQAQKAGDLSPEAQQNLAGAKALAAVNKSMGIINLSKMRTYINTKGHPQMKGDIEFVGKKGKISLHRMDETEVLFKIVLDKLMEVKLTEEKKLKIRTWYLLLSDGEQELYTRSRVFSEDERDMKITVGLNASDPQATGECSVDVPLEKIIPSAKDNSTLKQIILSDLNFAMPSPVFPHTLAGDISINCMAKMDHIKVFDKGKMPNSDCTISISVGMVNLSSESDERLYFDEDNYMQSPSLEVSAMAGTAPEFLIRGVLRLDGTFLKGQDIPATCEKTFDGFVVDGKMAEDQKFAGIKIGQPHVRIQRMMSPFDMGSGGFVTVYTVTGTMKFLGNKLIPTIRMMKTTRKAKMTPEFSAVFEGAKDIEPLKMIPGLNVIPGIKNFKLKDALVGMAKEGKKAFFIGGATTLLGLSSLAKIRFMKKGPGIEAKTRKSWRFSDSVPGTKGTPLDSVGMNSATIMLTSAAYFSHEYNMQLNKGLNFFGDVDTSQGAFGAAKSILGGGMPKKVVCAVMTSPNPRLCRLRVIIPLDLKLSDKASLHNIAFEISGEPSVALLIALKFVPQKRGQALIFTARIEFGLIGCTLAGTMAGMWQKPFGIPNLVIGNIAIELTLPYAAPPVPIGFGFAGTVIAGKKRYRVALKVGPDEVVVLLEIAELPIFAWLNLIKVFAPKLPGADFMDKVNIKFKDIKFKFAPVGGMIGELYFEPGISGQAKLMLKVPGLIDTQIFAGFNVDVMSGIKAWGMMPNLKMGPLKLSGAGKDRKWGTEDDGPIFYLVLSLTEQRIFISAVAELLGSTGLVEANVKLTGLDFKMMINILNALKVNIFAESYTNLKKGLIGFRCTGETKIGTSTTKLLGDISTHGLLFAGQRDSLTVKDIMSIAKLEKYAPDLGVKDAEFLFKMKA
ncbi:MAG: hypothetical protein PVJ92_00550 [Candidatus Dependentiae bacterium]|jgi:hypothetical protein